MTATLEYMKDPRDEDLHASWVVEGRVAIGRKEARGDDPGSYRIHFVAPPESADSIARCSNIEIGATPPNPTSEVQMPLPCITISVEMSEEKLQAIWDVAGASKSALEANPAIGPDELFRMLTEPSDYLGLILDDPVMSIMAQMGLVGEIQFMMKLLDRCAILGIPASRALNCWRNDSRDFFQNNIVFEVKSTGRQERMHLISRYKQLEPQMSDVELHVISASSCRDPGASKLPVWVDSLLDRLGGDDRSLALLKIRDWWRGSRGYDHGNRSSFTNEPGFSPIFEIKSFRVMPPMAEPLDHLVTSSFEDSDEPDHASEIKYTLDLSNGPQPLDDDDLDGAIDRMLSVGT